MTLCRVLVAHPCDGRPLEIGDTIDLEPARAARNQTRGLIAIIDDVAPAPVTPPPTPKPRTRTPRA